jgi:hypothetical protein
VITEQHLEPLAKIKRVEVPASLLTRIENTIQRPILKVSTTVQWAWAAAVIVFIVINCSVILTKKPVQYTNHSATELQQLAAQMRLQPINNIYHE